jgi:protein-S-isoprenylcysteine O-methyltransferase Ste14
MPDVYCGGGAARLEAPQSSMFSGETLKQLTTMSYQLLLQILLPALWIAWLIYWWASARNVKVTRWQEPPSSRLLHRVPMLLAALLLAAPRLLPLALRRRLVAPGPIVPTLGVILIVSGLGFSVWARRHLGRNWSSRVVVKEDHVLVRTGPYSRLRHPIYTGILLAFLGTVLIIGEVRGFIAFVLLGISFAIKSHAEEARMRKTFPEYEQYRRETSALIPYVF